MDTVPDLLDTSRTRILIDALRGQLDDLTLAEEFRRELNEATSM